MDGGRGLTRGMLPLLALHAASEFYRTGRKPPVTAGLLVANTLIYLRPGPLHRFLPSIEQVAFNPHLILKYGDLKRFFLSPLYHMGESHLVYNMMSLVWKGIQLETTMGSIEFISMLSSLLVMSQGITLLLAKSLLLLFEYDTPYYEQYAVGFSGVLFGLKVVLNSQSDDFTYMHGMVIPTRYAAWAELILIQMFVPGVSFLGHLGGILAGLLYLRLRSRFSGPDPISLLLKNVFTVVRWPLRFLQSLFGHHRSRISGRGTVGGQPRRTLSGTWRCPTCTYDNSALVNVCEMCRTERGGGGFTSMNRAHSRIADMSLEELRRRRLERFS